MKDGKTDKYPRTPYDDLNDVLAHHRATFGTLGVRLAEVKSEEGKTNLVNVAEEEPQRDNLNDAEQTERDVRSVQEFR